MGALIQPGKAKVLCNATLELLSARQRPYLFRVTVIGLPPHAHRRIYDIAAHSDDAAASKAIELFVDSCSRPGPLLEVIQ